MITGLTVVDKPGTTDDISCHEKSKMKVLVSGKHLCLVTVFVLLGRIIKNNRRSNYLLLEIFQAKGYSEYIRRYYVTRSALELV